MPEYQFNDIIKEGLRLSARRTQLSTQKTDAWNAKPLLRYFDQYWVTYDPMSTRRKVLVPERVFRYIEWRESEGVGVASIRREIAVASKCIRACAKYLYWQLPNPFENPPLAQAKPRKRKGTDAEIGALLEHAKQPLRDLILWYLNTWMRPSEGRLLQWHEVQGDRVVLDRQKNGSDMPLALSAAALDLLARQPRNVKDADGNVSPYVFNGADGKMLTKDGLAWLLRLARREASKTVPSSATLQLRDLRRTGATRALAQPGVTTEDIRAQLRHKRIRMTEEVYTQPSIERAHSAVEAAPWVVSSKNVERGS